MLGIAIIVAVVLALGVAFFQAARSGPPSLKKRGPWVVAGGAWVLATVALSTYDVGITAIFHPVRQHQIRDMLVTACVVGALTVEAVLISRWTLGKVPARASFLIVFSCVTLFAWTITFFAMWDLIPSS
jgi:hypothetical protein